MEVPNVKGQTRTRIQELPEEATLEHAMECLDFLAKIERGLEQTEAGYTISHEEIKVRFLK